jgi:hypothetical protein
MPNEFLRRHWILQRDAGQSGSSFGRSFKKLLDLEEQNILVLSTGLCLWNIVNEELISSLSVHNVLALPTWLSSV